MDIGRRFLDYAAAFEKTFEDDEWSRLEDFFTEDAVYAVTGGPPLGGRFAGRAALLEQLRKSVDELDRRFDARSVEMLGAPRATAVSISFDWRGTYRLAGHPDLVFGGSERALFEGDRICLLEDTLEAGTDATIQAWMAEHWT